MIIGIDEVGRGCWAGPLVAAAVALTQGVDGLNDSKKLSAVKRKLVEQKIKSSDAVIAVGWVWPEEINEMGLSKANALAMIRALNQVQSEAVADIIIDGKVNLLTKYSELAESHWLEAIGLSRTIVGADGKVAEVSAASIIAKVARDEYMHKLSKKYPQYGFSQHVGYGTKFHQNALLQFGVLPKVHRLNYKPIKALLST